ncbi:site-specific integrase, partial [Aeromonas hydrophila]
RDGVIYTVHGKGGLVREVLVPHALAERLEAVHLDAPQAITDRGIYYQSHYDTGGGQRWSNSVSAASERVLGWSTGAHGLRHSYAQERMAELQASLSRDAALTTVSQEMGHFRPEITETYLR